MDDPKEVIFHDFIRITVLCMPSRGFLILKNNGEKI